MILVVVLLIAALSVLAIIIGHPLVGLVFAFAKIVGLICYDIIDDLMLNKTSTKAPNARFIEHP